MYNDLTGLFGTRKGAYIPEKYLRSMNFSCASITTVSLVRWSNLFDVFTGLSQWVWLSIYIIFCSKTGVFIWCKCVSHEPKHFDRIKLEKFVVHSRWPGCWGDRWSGDAEDHQRKKVSISAHILTRKAFKCMAYNADLCIRSTKLPRKIMTKTHAIVQGRKVLLYRSSPGNCITRVATFVLAHASWRWICIQFVFFFFPPTTPRLIFCMNPSRRAIAE